MYSEFNTYIIIIIQQTSILDLMKKFINLLHRRITLGNLFTVIFSFIFAIALRQLFLYTFDILPIKGELQLTDVSFLSLIILSRFVLSIFFEYLLDDKYHTPLFKGLGHKNSTALYMENTANNHSSGQNSPKASGSGTQPKSASREPLTEEQRAEVRQIIENKIRQDPKLKKEVEETRKFNDEMFGHMFKMEDVLNEQSSKILQLSYIGSRNDVKFIQENGGLELSVPSSMTDNLANKLSNEVGALDRSLQNKFSEYENLSRKDVRLYDSRATSA